MQHRGEGSFELKTVLAQNSFTLQRVVTPSCYDFTPNPTSGMDPTAKGSTLLTDEREKSRSQLKIASYFPPVNVRWTQDETVVVQEKETVIECDYFFGKAGPGAESEVLPFR